MANLIAENFDRWVDQQVNVRQNALKKSSLNSQKTNEGKYAFKASTPFIRLSSGIKLTGGKTVQGYTGDSLAKDYVLFGGTTKYRGAYGSKFRAGVTDVYGKNDNAYGLNSTQETGLSPMPGITDIKVKSKNRGSLREASINVKCHNKYQFEIIETLYLRLKYSILLEWGHTRYLDNTGNISTSIPGTVIDKFFSGNAGQEEILDHIRDAREKSSGNYDAFFGLVNNFSWSIREDGGYDIEITAISVGDVIESLKANINAIAGAKVKAGGQSGWFRGADDQPFVKHANKNSITRYLSAMTNLLDTQDGSFFGFSYEVSVAKKATIPKTLAGMMGAANRAIKVNSATSLLGWIPGYNILTNAAKGVYNALNDPANPEAVRLEFNYDYEEQYYIKLGAFLEFLENEVLPGDTGQSNNTERGNEPLFKIDRNLDDNYCFTIPDSFSLDPRICIIPKFEGPYLQSIPEINSALGTKWRVLNNVFAARFLHTYVNINTITNIATNSVGEGNKISLYDFLSKLMKTIQKPLGNINDFEVIYDSEENIFRIIDNTVIPEGGPISYPKTKPTEFQVSLLTDKRGSFLTEAGFKTEITPQIASMLAIGAQANGNVVGENATAFSKWNVGLTDRIIKNKTDNIDPGSEEEDDSGGVGEDKAATFTDLIDELNTYLEDAIDGLYADAEQTDGIEGSATDFLNMQVGDYVNSNTIPGVGFIPLNLEIKMHGLSGMKIYQRYTINDDLLPESYKNKLDFLVKGLHHEVNENGWFTTLESLSVNKQEAIQDVGTTHNNWRRAQIERLKNEAINTVNDVIEGRIDG